MSRQPNHKPHHPDPGNWCLVGLVWLELDWIGLDWIGLVWIGLDWFGLDWIGLDWIGLVWFGLDWIGLDWIRLDWIRLDCIAAYSLLDTFIQSQGRAQHFGICVKTCSSRPHTRKDAPCFLVRTSVGGRHLHPWVQTLKAHLPYMPAACI